MNGISEREFVATIAADVGLINDRHNRPADYVRAARDGDWNDRLPAPPGGSIVKPEWFGRFDPVNPPEFDSVFQSWDTASKGSEISDFSVCTTWGRKGRQFFLLNVYRKRLEYPDLKRAVVEQARMWGAGKVLVEDASSGQALIQDLKNDSFYIVQAVKPKGDKIMRLNSVTAAIEAGQVFVPTQAPWLDEYLYELMMFPAGRYDDQVDSTSQALSNALLFPAPGDGWWEYIQEDSRRCVKARRRAFE